MSSCAAPVMKPPLGTWAEDVRSQTHVPTLQWSPTDLPWNPTEEHLMDALEARAFWLASQTESGAWLIKEYREWQFKTDLKCFVARCSGQSAPIHSYPHFTCMEVYNLFQSRGKSVPPWILNLTGKQFPEGLKWTLRPSELESFCSKSQSRVDTSCLSVAELRSEIAKLVSDASETLAKLSNMSDETLALEAVRDCTAAISLISDAAEKASEVFGKR